MLLSLSDLLNEVEVLFRAKADLASRNAEIVVPLVEDLHFVDLHERQKAVDLKLCTIQAHWISHLRSH